MCENVLQGGRAFSSVSVMASSKPQSPVQLAIVLPILKWSAKCSTRSSHESRWIPQNPQRDRIIVVDFFQPSVTAFTSFDLCTRCKCCFRWSFLLNIRSWQEFGLWLLIWPSLGSGLPQKTHTSWPVSPLMARGPSGEQIHRSRGM